MFNKNLPTIENFKFKAKMLAKNENLKLNEAQHRLSQEYGYKNYNTILSKLNTIDFGFDFKTEKKLLSNNKKGYFYKEFYKYCLTKYDFLLDNEIDLYYEDFLNHYILILDKKYPKFIMNKKYPKKILNQPPGIYLTVGRTITGGISGLFLAMGFIQDFNDSIEITKFNNKNLDNIFIKNLEFRLDKLKKKYSKKEKIEFFNFLMEKHNIEFINKTVINNESYSYINKIISKSSIPNINLKLNTEGMGMGMSFYYTMIYCHINDFIRGKKKKFYTYEDPLEIKIDKIKPIKLEDIKYTKKHKNLLKKIKKYD